MNQQKYMKSTTMNLPTSKFLWMVFAISAAFCLATALPAVPQAKPVPTLAARPGQKAFESAKQAADIMIAAIKNDDISALLDIFGPDGKDFVATGDNVQDKNSRAAFAVMAEEKMHVDVDAHNPNKAILSVGNEDWPLPVPIVRRNGKWYFDSKAGRTEMIDRRIGGNELDAISLCRGYVEAQIEYASEIHDDIGVNQYAQRVISTPGKHDGLSWRNADGTEGGPIGEEVAKAIEEGYTSKSEPFHGYFFKTLKGQGSAAPLGQLDYVEHGIMIGGFALVAWPAEYQVTGVQTFIVSYNGIVYQKDLGADTAKIAAAMELYNPDKTWQRTDDAE